MPTDPSEPTDLSRLSQIGTEKTGVLNTIRGTVPEPSPDLPPEEQRKIEEDRLRQRTARERQIRRYQRAGTAYINAMLKNSDHATAVWESVILKWLSGKLSGYDPSKSFRAYLKTVLRNEVRSFIRSLRTEAARSVGQLDEEYEAADKLEETASNLFDRHLHNDLIELTLLAIREENPQQYEVLKLIMAAAAANCEPPDSLELAKALSRHADSPVSEENARKIKSRARERFPRELIRQTQLLIQSENLDEVEEILADVRLLAYCEKALRKMREERGLQ
jgi:RNA polymerase sigma factor (sigma-70 family)